MSYLEEIPPYKENNLNNLDSIISSLDYSKEYFCDEDYNSFIKYDSSIYPHLGKSNKKLFELYYETSFDDNIRETIVLSNIKLVNWCIRIFFWEVDIPMLDLQLVGLEGLVKAVDMFDSKRCDNFSKYAVRCITSCIRDKFKEICGITYVDYSDFKKYQYYKDEIYKLSPDHNEELQEIDDIKYEKIYDWNRLYTCKSLDSEKIIDEDYNIELEIYKSMLDKELKEKLSILTERQRLSILYEFGLLNYFNSREEVAKLFNVSGETIRNDAKKALEILKKKEEIDKEGIPYDNIYSRIYELYKQNIDFENIINIIMNENELLTRRKARNAAYRFNGILDMCSNTSYEPIKIVIIVFDRWKEKISIDFVNTLISENRYEKNKLI